MGFVKRTHSARFKFPSAPGSELNLLHISARTLVREKDLQASTDPKRARPASPLVSSIVQLKKVHTNTCSTARHRRSKRMQKPRTGALYHGGLALKGLNLDLKWCIYIRIKPRTERDLNGADRISEMNADS